MDSMLKAMGFRRVVDYGVPTHYECPACGRSILISTPAPCHRVGTGVVVTPIPVFAVIPEGERPQTTWGETGGDDAVCFGDVFGDAEYIIGFEAHLPYGRLSGRRCALQDGDQWARWGALSSSDKRDDPNDIVGAIRHVAEE